MITIIQDAPDNVAAFRANGQITKEDFENVVIPHVKAKVEIYDELNYLFHLDTKLKEFTVGAWMQDAWLGIKNLTKWNRCAIISDEESIHIFTENFSKIMLGEFKAFTTAQLGIAAKWCETGEEFVV